MTALVLILIVAAAMGGIEWAALLLTITLTIGAVVEASGTSGAP